MVEGLKQEKDYFDESIVERFGGEWLIKHSIC